MNPKMDLHNIYLLALCVGYGRLRLKDRLYSEIEVDEVRYNIRKWVK